MSKYKVYETVAVRQLVYLGEYEGNRMREIGAQIRSEKPNMIITPQEIEELGGLELIDIDIRQIKED
ncbi:hypothetical protein [Paenibacillus polymyxa]|uniref:hypothetical protein n=1 Tax=Paenibacillus polymyxa TaxID=1406 RepID=UPI0008FBB9F6|nr:hypothetical protein [Paenibacillus polymyxa]APB75604.1 hypothetical protein PPYC2_11705 [Paenibacillus polymyxa]POR25563.1 hypothetical protein CG775_21840 [Paenibacillus polymyxa]